MKTVFFGASRFVIPIIELLRKKFDLALVIATEQKQTDSIPNYCKKYAIPYISVKTLSEENLKSYIINLKSDLGILAYFGLLVPTDILSIFPRGILNVHPSLLPKYRGPTPVQTAILNGDKKTGISIIKLDEELDHGPILVQAEEPILPNDTTETLHERLFKIGAKLLDKNIDQYLDGKIELKKQEHDKATYTKPLTRADGYVNISKVKTPCPPMLCIGKCRREKSKLKIERMIRAYYPWPGTWTRIKLKSQNSKVKIVKFLSGKKLQVEGKRPMSYKDFINGYPHAKSVIEKLT